MKAAVSVIDTDDMSHAVPVEDAVDLLLFGLGTAEVFGINVLKVSEITQHTTITKSPNLPEGVIGFVSMRGAAIPVFELSFFFNKPHKSLSKLSDTLIVLECCSLQFALHVHELFSISRVSVTQLKTYKKEKESDQSCIVSVLNMGQVMVSIIDIEMILGRCYPQVIPLFDNDPNNRFVHYPPVVVVDDSSLCRRYIKDVLESLGLSCKLAASGLDGQSCLLNLLDRLDKEKKVSILDMVSLVILDEELPGMSGYELSRFIRNDHRLSAVPIIMHSAIPGNGSTARYQHVFHINHHVFKFNLPALVEAIHSSIH